MTRRPGLQQLIIDPPDLRPLGSDARGPAAAPACSDCADRAGSAARPAWRVWIVRLICAVLAASLACDRSAWAQPGDGATSGNRTSGAISGQGPLGAEEVRIDLERFGVGDLARAGELAGVRVRLLDQGAKPREVIIRLEGRDPDGDTPLFERQVVLNPGTLQGVWLYPLIPPGFDSNDRLKLSVYEALETTGDADAKSPDSRTEGSTAAREGRLLGRIDVSPRQGRIALHEGVIGVVAGGNISYGMADYGLTDGNNPWPVAGHELIKIIEGLRPVDLPDRWMGYSGWSAIVWGTGEPSELRGDRAAALREWVRRGGHLIIILPTAGQTWTNAQTNELFDILPTVSVSRREGVGMEAYRPLLTRRTQARLPRDGVVHTFTIPAAARAGDAMRVLNNADGECVVARRIYGSGAVTLVGLDLNNRMLSSQEAINADVFWSRVLGRRGQVPSSTEAQASAQSRPMLSRADRIFDADISASIAKSGRSAAGLLLALVVFALYWIVAGPGGYAALKRAGIIRHAWLVFLASAGVFTVIAWGGATLLRPSKLDATHLTLLDHVYGQPTQRARSWLSVLIPWYGQATVEIGDEPAVGDAATRGGGDVIVPWTSPEQGRGDQDSFPDSRGYAIESRAPRRITFPTRSTVKQLRADWAGGPTWKMPAPVGPGGVPGTGELALAQGRKVTGTLVHELPGPLMDVRVVVIRPQKPLGISLGNAMITNAYAYSLAAGDAWDPGELLDLAKVTDVPPSESVDAAQYFERLLERGSLLDAAQGNDPGADLGIADRLTALAFFSQLPPPNLSESSFASQGPPVARRSQTHGWDLGRWFTQPCLIIVGHLGSIEDPRPSPVPMRIDGEPIAATGRTVVRWVYPFPDSPPTFTGQSAADGDADKPEAPGVRDVQTPR
jgi:hypothetical protein